MHNDHWKNRSVFIKQPDQYVRLDSASLLNFFVVPPAQLEKVLENFEIIYNKYNNLFAGKDENDDPLPRLNPTPDTIGALKEYMATLRACFLAMTAARQPTAFMSGAFMQIAQATKGRRAGTDLAEQPFDSTWDYIGRDFAYCPVEAFIDVLGQAKTLGILTPEKESALLKQMPTFIVKRESKAK